MRKLQQQQILELLETVKEAQTEELYEDCIEGARVVGEFIEALEGEGTRTVALLEEYCEIVFKAINDEAGFEELEAKRLGIIESVRTELKPNLIEVAFIVCQLCMFDSFETIYNVARDDPNCDAIIIPIPFYDVSYDAGDEKKLGMMYYDGDKFPANIPVTDWQTYDIEMRHPDIIYTHYPYDNLGGNMSIHPDYYSKKLKQHCDMLVNVPYFVAAGDKVDDYNCYLPGVLHADKVIVQSEAVRKSYIKGFKKYEKENKWKGAFGKAEDKFVALGSPKFDKVIKSKQEDFELPEAWRKLIFGDEKTGADGEKTTGGNLQSSNRKKVILYNTHMFAWINNVEQYFKKIRHVFKTFKEHDDTVLWWRPHPGTEQNFRAYRPKNVAELTELINEYKRDGWGIYDDTPDLHRAIAWSDAYYGDWSSLVSMYGITGKPLMMQNRNMVPPNDFTDNSLSLAAYEYHDDGTYFWFSSYSFNGLYRMKKDTHTVEFMGRFPGEDLFERALFNAVTAVGNKMYFAPGLAECICIYDKETGQFERIPVNAPPIQPKSEYKGLMFNSCVAYHNYVFFVGTTLPFVLRYNTDTGSTDYYYDWHESLDEILNTADDSYSLNVFTVEHILYIPICNANAVLIFNMETCKAQLQIIGSKDGRYRCGCYDGTDCWLLPRTTGPLIRLNPKTLTWTEVDAYPEGFKHAAKLFNFRSIFYAAGYIWIFPLHASMVLKLDVKTDEVTAVEAFGYDCNKEFEAYDFVDFNFVCSFFDGTIIYAHTGKSNMLIEYNPETEQRMEYSLKIPDKKAYPVYDIYRNMQSENMKKTQDSLLHEVSYNCLDSYLYYIACENIIEKRADMSKARMELFRKAEANADGTAAEAIHTYIVSELKKRS